MVEIAAYKVPGNWKLLWKLVVPPKFRSFMWRVVRDCVPIRVRLQAKFLGVVLDKRRCLVWEWLNCLINQWSSSSTRALGSVCFKLWSNCCGIFAVTTWSLWRSRNLTIWENKVESPAYVVCRGRVLLEDWRAARGLDSVIPRVGAQARQFDSMVSSSYRLFEMQHVCFIFSSS